MARPANRVSSGAGTAARAGDRLAGVPERTANAGITYRQKVSSNYSLMERVDVSYESGRSTVVPPQNPAYFVARAYELADLHLRLDRADGRAPRAALCA